MAFSWQKDRYGIHLPYTFGCYQITDVMEVPLAYIPGNVTRVKVKAVGDLNWKHLQMEGVIWHGELAQHEQGIEQLELSEGTTGIIELGCRQ